MRIRYFFGIIFSLHIASEVSGQCPGFSHPRNPGASTNVLGAGSTPWEFPYPSTQSSNNTYTNMRMGTVLTSQYLSVYNWGYGYTTGTICGVKVRVEKAAPATNPGTVTDLEAKLFNGASYSPNNYADAVTPWPSADTYFTYGSNSDLWGFASITAAQINNVNFAFRFRAQRTDVNDSAKIDHVEITGYSDELLPVELLSFDAKKNIENRSVDFIWQCASETNNHFFTLERSRDNVIWDQVRSIDGAGNSSVVTNYETTDTEPFPGQSYYRLKQTDFDGTTKVIDIISVRFKNYLDDVMLYPSLASDLVNIKAISDLNNSLLVISDVTGRVVKDISLEVAGEAFEYSINISDLTHGLYFVKILNKDLTVYQRFIKK